MQEDGQFRETYVALIALNWAALERVEHLLPASREAWATPGAEGCLQWLRLELLQLGDSAARCSMRQRLSLEQHELVQSMIATLLEWLDFDAGTATEVVRLRLAAAQDWLLDEVGRMGRGADAPALDRRRG